MKFFFHNDKNISQYFTCVWYDSLPSVFSAYEVSFTLRNRSEKQTGQVRTPRYTQGT